MSLIAESGGEQGRDYSLCEEPVTMSALMSLTEAQAGQCMNQVWFTCWIMINWYKCFSSKCCKRQPIVSHCWCQFGECTVHCVLTSYRWEGRLLWKPQRSLNPLKGAWLWPYCNTLAVGPQTRFDNMVSSCLLVKVYLISGVAVWWEDQFHAQVCVVRLESADGYSTSTDELNQWALRQVNVVTFSKSQAPPLFPPLC